MEISNKLNLYPALLRVQSTLSPILKSKPAYGYKYAELATVIEKVTGALNKEGILVLQLPVISSRPEHSAVCTRFIHAETGEYVESTIEVPYTLSKQMSISQSHGGASTYAQRYALVMMIGVPTEDDDGASGAPPKPATKPATITKLSEAQLIKAKAKVAEIMKALQPLDNFLAGEWLGTNPKEVEALRWIKKNFPIELQPLIERGITV